MHFMAVWGFFALVFVTVGRKDFSRAHDQYRAWWRRVATMHRQGADCDQGWGYRRPCRYL